VRTRMNQATFVYYSNAQLAKAPRQRPELRDRWGIVYLDVPREDNSSVKAMGGRFDKQRRLWYTHRSRQDILDQWELTYLHVPYGENSYAKEMGATFDRNMRLWHTRKSKVELTSRWGLVYLDVPFSEKEEAKSLGAHFDPRRRLWHVPQSLQAAVQRWQRKAFALVCEDRSFGGHQLFVDMVPSTCWFSNARTCLSSHDWERIRQHVYERVDYRCETCHVDCGRLRCADGSEAPRLESHERWHFDAQSRIQRLERLVALCHHCHEATHMKLADTRGRGHAAREHLQRVTGMSPEEVEAHVAEAYRIWGERSRHQWELDLSLLSESGFELLDVPDKARRAQLAIDRLAEQDAVGKRDQA